MPRLSRDAWLALLLFAVLALFTFLAAAQETRANLAERPFSPSSTGPQGVRALREWLTALDYTVVDLESASFAAPAAANLTLMFEPRLPVSEAEWAALDGWVEEGGTLLLAGSGLGTRLAASHYDVSLRRAETVTATLALETPLPTGPALPRPFTLTVPSYLETERRDAVTLVSGNGRPLAVAFPQGAGRVIVATLADAFTNRGLGEAGNPALALNLLSLGGSAGGVWFNQWHQGVRPGAETGQDWLRRTPVGQALLLAGLILFVAVALRGRRFGRPLSLPADRARRAPLEYITAIANLNRRAGHRTAVLQDTHDRLKRHLGHRYRLSPDLPDAEFVTQLSEYNPALDAAALRDLLRRLSQTDVGEAEMVRLVAAAARWQQ
jgi:hypothetical protein